MTFPARAIPKNHALLQIRPNIPDLTNYCSAQQFTIILHLPNEIPTPFHESYPFEFGRLKKFRLNAVSHETDKTLKGYTAFRRNCYLQSERQLKFFKSYTKAQCDFECMTNYTLDTCGCVKFSMPRDTETRVCNLEEAVCYVEAMENFANNSRTGNSDKPCDCLSTCTFIKYDLKVETDVVLGKHYSEKFSAFALIQTFDYVVDVHVRMVNYNIQSFM